MNKSLKKIRFLIPIIAICFFVLSSENPALADTTIDTTPSWTGLGYLLHGYDGRNPQTIGQSITVPSTDTVLQNFTFYVRALTTFPFRGYVYAWNGSRAVGPELYESATMHTTQQDDYETVTFTIPGGLELTAGSQYILFVSTSRLRVSGSVRIGNFSPGSGGEFRIRSLADDSLWTGEDWRTSDGDLAFTAFFNSDTQSASIPTMNEWGIIILIALAGLSSVYYMRRQKRPL